MKILIFEDDNFNDLFPLSMMRGVFDVRIGINTIKDRIEFINGNKFEIGLLCRKNLAPYLSEIHNNPVNKISKEDHLLLNGKIIFSENSLKYLISKKEKNTFYTFKNEIIAAYISKDKSELLNSVLAENSSPGISRDLIDKLNLKQFILKDDFKITVINYPWDILKYVLHGGLNEDFEYFNTERKKYSHPKDRDVFVNRKKIFISKDVNINSSVVLDASDGNIIISENVNIEPFTFIKGPVFIGKNSLVKSGTKIYGPCVIGENSKVAGEIAESIFHSYVNKQHDGFVGHSYICPFVNLGADTVTSDLKNNYSKIKMNSEGIDVNTDMQFLGSIIGDHTKTSINTMLNTGTKTGIFANIFGGGFPDKNIGSFSWFNSDKEPPENNIKYDFSKAIETAKIVMERRGQNLSEAYKDLAKKYC